MGPRIIKLSFSEVNLESFSNKNHICCKTLTLSSFKYLHFVFTWTLQIIVYWINRFSDIENKLPVMFWIHGGSFLFGDNTFDQYGPNQFMKDQNVILITINYRVGPIGFLSMGTEMVPGNAGFRDQNMAMTWVHDYISSFGGDPDLVTIFGESAGSFGVAMHLISPLSRGLYRRAIMESSTALSPGEWLHNLSIFSVKIDFATFCYLSVAILLPFCCLSVHLFSNLLLQLLVK